MITTYLQQQSAHLTKIIDALPLGAEANFSHFVERFYAKAQIDDLLALDPKKAIAVAKSAYEFMEERSGSNPKLRLYAANKKQNGYDSKHMVLELINDDMPFLVDSLSMGLNRLGFVIYSTIHPIFSVSRDKNGTLTTIGEKGENKESLIRFEISSLPDGMSEKDFFEDLEWILLNVRSAVSDWKKILEKVEATTALIKTYKQPESSDSIAEIEDFLKWLVERNFIFLGYSEYRYFDDSGKEVFQIIEDSKLGVLKVSEEKSLRGWEALPPKQRPFLFSSQIIEMTKSNHRSLVHRPVLMDYIVVKRFDKSGNAIGEIRFLGLFTSNVYYQGTESIPLIRHKVARTLERSEFDPASHDGKSLKTILEFLPRDEIFQMSDDEMLETSIGILALEAKPQVRIFARRDALERFITFMIFVPRERFSTELRKHIQEIIGRNYDGVTSSFSTQISEAPLARLNLIVRTKPGQVPNVSLASVEKEIAKSAYQWSDLLAEAIAEKQGEEASEKLLHVYGGAFPQSYINRYDTISAVADIEKIDEALTSGELSLELYQGKNDSGNYFHLKIYNPTDEIALSEILPLLENAGFWVIEEHPFLIKPLNYSPVWIRDFRLQHKGETLLDFEQVKPLLEEALLKVWRGEMENDKFNALIIKAGLNWRQVTLLRAYAKYLKQAGFLHGQMAIWQAFATYPDIIRAIVDYFESRFKPEAKKNIGDITKSLLGINHSKPQEFQFEEKLAKVESAIHDRIFRRYIEVINATLRTNFFQSEENGLHKPVLSLKFDSAQVPELPKPVPFAEIFVYSPRLEGIHLRGGKVARGGLRWSDRVDDFRTEVLGLMKAQMVKNSVIVPVGSKGGFVLKKAPAERDKLQQEAIFCYRQYLSGMLDITDNIVKGKIIPPANTVRYDGDDPYLVVAADKGTATFSDIANSVSESYGFWLGDAFASGGSAGYDHKKMAITARGAFISVHRHFAEMGVDIDTTPFTAVGIGDMAGDVFGNGMLLSNNIRLVAAFNHLHIFIDPTPDQKTSFAERKRMFELPRSNWTDYDKKLISAGGGIYERSAKSITLSKEAQSALNIDKATLSPDELIRAIILAPVDLLWNGGIGTYVKSEEETDDQVGDRANNAVRVNGWELRCKVIGEGGNLGFTQKGRIEYARNHGRINTDAIDNSAGVDCSDHEVNIKIAFSADIASKKLTIEKRDTLLASMTDEVAELVLKDNILQTKAISAEEAQGVKLLDSQIRLIQHLEKQGLLNRAIEFLPNDKQLSDLKLAGRGLTRPEIAVLLSYSKMSLYNELLASTLPDDEYFVGDLKNYFPQAMREEFLSSILKHPLRREIIATVITNDIINQTGTSFVYNLAQDLNVSLFDVTSAYIIVRDLFKDADSDRLMESSISWLLRHMKLPLDISVVIKDLEPSISDIKAGSGQLSSAFDIITIARKTKKPASDISKLYTQIGDNLYFDWLRACAQNLSMDSHFDRLAAQAIIGDLYDEQQRITSLVLSSGQSFEQWQEDRTGEFTRYDNAISEIGTGESASLPKLMVALRYLKAFI